MGTLFRTYLYNPILAVLVFIYEHLSFGDLGVAIIFLTVFIRAILFPLFWKGAKDQTLLQRIQPHVKRIQRDHRDDKERQARELMNLYREHRLNPFSSIFILIVQLPIFFALFQIFRTELHASVFDNQTLLGLIDVAAPNGILVIVAALLQYLLSKLSLPKPSESDGHVPAVAPAMRVMVYVAPVITAVVLWKLPAALALYWSVSNIISVAQQLFVNKAIVKNAPVPSGGKPIS